MTKTIHTFGLVCAALVATTSMAQVAPYNRDAAPFQQDEAQQLNSPALRSGGGPIWSEDFGNGFPAGWTTTDNSGICPWKWSLDGSWGFFNGNSGTASGDTIQSTTAANGFLIADNDSANNVNFGQPSGTNYQYLATYFTTSAIDLTGYPNVNLEFEQFFRYNNSPVLSVEVSNDSVTWQQWDVKGSVVANSASPNVDVVSLNISGVAGDQPTVYIRIGWDARVYFWMIDDMRITETPANDLRLESVNYSEWFFDLAPDFGALEYSIYPNTQLRPFTFKGKISNQGYVDQPNTTFSVDITDANMTSVHSDSKNYGTLPSLASDSVYVDATYTPSGANGDFTIAFSLDSDSTDFVPGDNVATRSYSVSDFIFARDRNSLSSNYDNQGDAYELGNWFNIVNSGDMIYGVDVAIDDLTPPGLLIYGSVYDLNRDLIDVTEEYEVQAADLNAPGENKFVTLKLTNPIPLNAGEDYFVAVGHFGGSDNLVVGTSGNSLPQTSLIYDSPVDTWFYLTRTPMVRMNLDMSIGIDEASRENGAALGQNFPNPANGTTTISYDLERAAQVSLEVRDAQGKLVMTLNEGNRAAGLHTVTFDTQALSEGVYAYTLRAGEARITKRMMVVR